MAMFDYAKRSSKRFSSVPQEPVAVSGGGPNRTREPGGLEMEDILILVLSALLVLVTIWVALLATGVL